MGLLPPVMFPDVELWLSDHLRGELVNRGHPDVRVATNYKQVPRSVQIRRDGGPRLDAVREAARMGISVRADGPTGGPANDLARLVHALIGACPNGKPVLAVTLLTGPIEVDDPNGQPLRYLTAELIVRGSTI
jgi:hypothetical protein